MPVYTYRCSNCGVQFERHQSFTDQPLKTCPECRKKTLKKVITPSKVIFKGSGFYITDYKRAGEKQPTEGDAKPATESKPAKESKPAAESKPATESKRSDSAKKKTDSGGK